MTTDTKEDDDDKEEALSEAQIKKCKELAASNDTHIARQAHHILINHFYTAATKAAANGDEKSALAAFKQAMPYLLTFTRQDCVTVYQKYLGKNISYVAWVMRGIKMKHEDAEAYFLLGRYYAEQGKDADAIRCYETAVKNNPSHIDAQFWLGDQYKSAAEKEITRNTTQSIALYKKTIACYMAAAKLCCRCEFIYPGLIIQLWAFKTENNEAAEKAKAHELLEEWKIKHNIKEVPEEVKAAAAAPEKLSTFLGALATSPLWEPVAPPSSTPSSTTVYHGCTLKPF